MRCLTGQECADWCRDHKYPVVDSGKYGRPAPSMQGHYHYFPLAYPRDSGAKVELSIAVLNWIVDSHEFLLWIDDWAVWPSFQHMPLFMRFREALGENRPLIDAPGHLLSKNEFDDAVSVLATSLLFLWDCHVFSDRGGRAFFCSHDEWNTLFLANDAEVSGAMEAFSHWLVPEQPDSPKNN